MSKLELALAGLSDRQQQAGQHAPAELGQTDSQSGCLLLLRLQLLLLLVLPLLAVVMVIGLLWL